MNKVLIIVTGPSGAGKNTVMNHIRSTFPEVAKAVTYTTRAPRPHEIDGIDYRFVAEKEFFAMVQDGRILEYEQVYNDYYYGSPADIFADGNMIIMEMDWKDHRKYRAVYKDTRIISIFLVPPSLEEVQNRILGRSQVDNLDSRMVNALEQLEHAGEYSYIIINACKDKMLAEVEAIIRTELVSVSRTSNLEFALSLVEEYKK